MTPSIGISSEGLREIIERVEKAEGPDREIDCLLWAYLIDGRTVTYLENNLVVSDKPGDVQIILGWIDPGKVSRNFSTSRVEPKEYTASIDAALALMERVLPGAGWERMIQPDNTVLIYVWGEDGPGKAFETAAGTAVAIILATLRALQSQEGSTP